MNIDVNKHHSGSPGRKKNSYITKTVFMSSQIGLNFNLAFYLILTYRFYLILGLYKFTQEVAHFFRIIHTNLQVFE